MFDGILLDQNPFARHPLCWNQCRLRKFLGHFRRIERRPSGQVKAKHRIKLDLPLELYLGSSCQIVNANSGHLRPDEFQTKPLRRDDSLSVSFHQGHVRYCVHQIEVVILADVSTINVGCLLLGFVEQAVSPSRRSHCMCELRKSSVRSSLMYSKGVLLCSSASTCDSGHCSHETLNGPFS